MKYPYYLIIALIILSLPASATGKTEFDFNVYVLDDSKDSDVDVYGVFTAAEGEYGGIELVFYDEGYNFSIKAIDDIQDLASKLKSDNIVMGSNKVFLLIHLFLKPTLTKNKEIQINGIMKKMANVRKSGEPLFEYSEEELDFALANNGEKLFEVASAIPDKNIRLKLSVQSTGMPIKTIDKDDITFETEYSLYNVSDSRYEINDEKCKLKLVMDGKDKKWYCSHQKIFDYQRNDSILYSIYYDIPDYEIDSQGMLTLVFNVSRTYAINPSFDHSETKGASVYSHTSIYGGSSVSWPADITAEKMVTTSFNKAITVQRGERTEIEIPDDKDSPLPFESRETIVLYNPEEFVPVDVMPEMLYEAIPVYPTKALASKAEGIVWIKAYVDKQGIVRNAEAVKCDRPGYGFEEAALEAAHENKYKPATREGKPVALWITYAVEFTLGLEDQQEKKN